MITITCKCKAQTATFVRMNPKDFPNGWESECCKKAKAPKEEPKAEEKKPEPKAVAEEAAPEVPKVEEKKQSKKERRAAKKAEEAPKAE